jgi:hypothetical protein
MPPTHVIIWERRGRLAAEARRLLDDAPAAVVEVRDEREFRLALQAARFPVLILDRPAVGDKIAEAIAMASLAEARIVVVGAGLADEERRDGDLGAHLLLKDVPGRLEWQETLRRIVRASQERYASSFPLVNRGTPVRPLPG